MIQSLPTAVLLGKFGYWEILSLVEYDSEGKIAFPDNDLLKKSVASGEAERREQLRLAKRLERKTFVVRHERYECFSALLSAS